MKVQYWAGHITSGIIQETTPTEWAAQLLQRASAAEGRGNTLVIFEIPKDDQLPIVGGIEEILQTDYGNIAPETAQAVRNDMQFTDAAMLQAFLSTVV